MSRRKKDTHGGVLSREDIHQRLLGGEIFRQGTWSADNLRSAAYDLRMAEDLMVVPDAPEYATGRLYRRNQRRMTEVILKPGDVAFVSTRERVGLPWNLAAFLGGKFSLTARGVLVLTGGLVDPGYGLEQATDGSWTAKADERLHFLLANVGPSPVVLVPGDTRIAAMQFFWVAEPAVKEEVRNVGFGRIEDEFMRSAESRGAGLVFFRDMANVRDRVEGFRQRIEEFDGRLQAIEKGSSQVVMFGLYLVCITFLGVAFAAVLSAAASGGLSKTVAELHVVLARYWASVVVWGLAALGCAYIGWSAFSSVSRAVNRLIERMARK